MDLALGVLLPFHFHFCKAFFLLFFCSLLIFSPVLRDVIRDYVPNPKAWQYVLLGVSGKKKSFLISE
jgi:hypothetical protein